MNKLTVEERLDQIEYQIKVFSINMEIFVDQWLKKNVSSQAEEIIRQKNGRILDLVRKY